MKKNDIGAIVIIVVIAGIISYFLASRVVGKPQNNPVQVEQVTKIAPTFPAPDSRVFNEKAIDPTVEITGSGQSTETPFTN